MTVVLRPETRAFLDLLALVPPPTETDMAVIREQTRLFTADNDVPRPPLADVRDVVLPGPGGALPARLYTPVAGRHAAAPVVLYFHGGGWTVCSVETHDALCGEIARNLGLSVVSVDYRLAPENKFPAAAEDAMAATRWLAGAPDAIGHAVEGIVLAGDSAGGNLAAVGAQLNGTLPLPILAQALFYPSLDMTARGGSLEMFATGHLLTAEAMTAYRMSYLPTADIRSHPHASPFLADGFARLPPTLVFTCECDPLRDQGRAYAAKLAQHGVSLRYREAKGEIHGCFNFRKRLPAARGDLKACLLDLRSLIEDGRARAAAGL